MGKKKIKEEKRIGISFILYNTGCRTSQKYSYIEVNNLGLQKHSFSSRFKEKHKPIISRKVQVSYG